MDTDEILDVNIKSENIYSKYSVNIFCKYYHKRIRAAISVEAAIVLSIFLIAFFTIVCVFSFVTAQVVLQNACSQLVREISEYSYIYRKVDVEELKKSDLLDGLELSGLNKKIINFGINDILLKNKVKKYVRDDDSDEFLKKLGIVNGLDGLDFLCTDALNEDGQMTIIIHYRMRNRMQILIKRKFDFYVAATTISLGSELKDYDYSFEVFNDDIGSDENGENEEGINIWDIIPCRRTDKFKEYISEEKNYKITDDRVGLDFYNEMDDELIYLHSLNTICKSYMENNHIKEEIIYKKIENYVNSMLSDFKSREFVSVNGELVENKRDRCKLLIILNSETEFLSDDYEKIKNELIEKYRKENDDIYIDIEIEFSDGKT